jgi:deazaflavin-dependent oxidoreductase (nitroreductase family)
MAANLLSKESPMSTTFQPTPTGLMAYPARGSVNRLIYKAPLIFWRMGLGPVLGQAMLILTTWGRKSHWPRHTALSYIILNGIVYLAPGWPEQSDWYKNLQADPHVTVQLGEGYFYATARRVTEEAEFAAVAKELLEFGDVLLKPWLASLGIEPELEDLVANRARVVLLALDWTNEAGPGPMPVDLTWLWWVIGITYLLGWVNGRISARKH